MTLDARIDLPTRDAVVDMDADRNLHADTFISLTSGTVLGFQFAFLMALAATREGWTATPAEQRGVQQYIRFKRVQYGSPIQFIIDLEPALKLLSDNGYVIFLGIAVKLFQSATTGWKTLEEGLSIRAERKAKSRKRKRKTSPPAVIIDALEVVEPVYEIDATDVELEIDQLNAETAFVEPLAQVAADAGGDYRSASNAGFQIVRSITHAQVVDELAKRKSMSIALR
jgi:hypothetical protein